MEKVTNTAKLALGATILAITLVGCDSAGSAQLGEGSLVNPVGSSAPAPEEAELMLSIEDPQDRALINELLDYFTEDMLIGDSVNATEADAETMVSVALQHLGVYNDVVLEGVEETDIRVEGSPTDFANGRVNAAYIQEACKEAFGRQAPLDGLAQGLSARFAYVDGYVYFGTTAPFGQVAFYPAVTSIEPLGGNEFRVTFAVLSNSMPFGLTEDGEQFDVENLFPLTTNEMMQLLGTDTPRCYGEAIVRGDADGESKVISLVSLTLQPADDTEDAAADLVEAEKDVDTEEGAVSADVADADDSTELAGPADAVIYETDLFTIALPGSWADRWSVEYAEIESRPAMNASNYGYLFSLDGDDRFSIQCKLFNLYGYPEHIGDTSTGVHIELHAYPELSSEDESFIREHIELK